MPVEGRSQRRQDRGRRRPVPNELPSWSRRALAKRRRVPSRSREATISVVTKTWWVGGKCGPLQVSDRSERPPIAAGAKEETSGDMADFVIASSRPPPEHACGTFHGKAGRAHALAIAGTLSSPRPSLASGSTCSSPAVSKQSSEGSLVNDWFGSAARHDVHASSRRRCVSLTAASNPIHTRRAGKFGLQTLSRDGQINDRVSSVKAQIDIPAPRPSAGNPFPSRVAGPPLLTK
jgi:hypothetical protein